MTKIDNVKVMSSTPSKELNTKAINAQLEKKGLSASDIASKLDVSRQIVSQWLLNKKLPRPAKLLELARLLELSFQKILIRTESPNEPVIAFRKKKGHKIEASYIDEAKEKGRLLELLVPYLPFDNMSSPPSLIKPSSGYDYVQKAAEDIRKGIVGQGAEKIEFKSLISFFENYHATLIPVFWGHKERHENALHIYLPEKMTTWIYLNLDSRIHDFKFWMAHELGHVKAPSLKNDDGEDFADAFAGALLFGTQKAKSEYANLRNVGSRAKQINRLKQIANELVVSPLTIYYEINKYATATEQPRIDLDSDRAIYKACTNLNKEFKTVAQTLFDDKTPAAKKYMECCSEMFKSGFFDALGKYIKKEKKSPSFIQNLLNISLVDAQELYAEIS